MKKKTLRQNFINCETDTKYSEHLLTLSDANCLKYRKKKGEKRHISLKMLSKYFLSYLILYQCCVRRFFPLEHPIYFLKTRAALLFSVKKCHNF